VEDATTLSWSSAAVSEWVVFALDIARAGDHNTGKKVWDGIVSFFQKYSDISFLVDILSTESIILYWFSEADVDRPLSSVCVYGKPGCSSLSRTLGARSAGRNGVQIETNAKSIARRQLIDVHSRRANWRNNSLRPQRRLDKS